MHNLFCVLVSSYLILNTNLVVSKATFRTNPIISSIFSPQKETNESHITKIPSKITKEKLETATIEPTDPPPSFVERKIGKAVEKILTLSQLVNSIRAAPENFEENENGFTTEDQTNQPPSFVEQKIGRIVEKLFRISQFANNVRERFNMPPNHIFEYVNENESKESSKEQEEIDFDKIFAERNNSEENKKYIPLIRTGDEKEIESIQSISALKEIKKINDTFLKVNKCTESKKDESRDMKELDFENMEAFKVYLFNKNQLPQKYDETPKKEKGMLSNETNSLINKTVADNEIIMGDIATIKPSNSSINTTKPSNSSINVDFSSNDSDNDNKNEGSTLKQTAEKVGYFVLEIFASIVGLTLGAVSQINHVFHQSNNTILQGIYNSTH